MTLEQLKQLKPEIRDRIKGATYFHKSARAYGFIQNRAGRYIGLSYQSCRFCKRAATMLEGLFKYASRAYICHDCREEVIRGSA